MLIVSSYNSSSSSLTGGGGGGNLSRSSGTDDDDCTENLDGSLGMGGGGRDMLPPLSCRSSLSPGEDGFLGPRGEPTGGEVKPTNAGLDCGMGGGELKGSAGEESLGFSAENGGGMGGLAFTDDKICSWFPFWLSGGGTGVLGGCEEGNCRFPVKIPGDCCVRPSLSTSS